jgi:RimJ/RimL family protein N-acetyltransferase
MARPVLRTQRIELRPMTVEHLPLLHRLDSDPEVMRHLLGRARTPEEIEQFWRPRCVDIGADAVGLGAWVGFHSDDFLGWWELTPTDPELGPDTERAEIGWRMQRRHWEQGLATEGAEALLTYGFHTLRLKQVWAQTMAVNTRSRGVMRKLGMSHVHTEICEWENPLPGSDEGEVTYQITAGEWRRGQRDDRTPSQRPDPM